MTTSDWKTNALAVKAIMGLETANLHHPMWSEVMVLNGLAYITIWVDELPAWSGIADMEEYRIVKLKNAFPDCEIAITELKAGVHY